jgi:enoyl-CoA hydratase
MANNGRIVTERRDGGIFVMTLDREEKRNGVTPEMWEQLCSAYEELETDSSIRVGLLRATGPHFTGGMDLPRYREARSGKPILLTPEGRLDPMGLSGPQRTKPVVVAVEGICFTVGLELALASDVVVAGASARFSQLEVKRGVIPFGGATIRMVRRAGWGNAMSVLLTGDEFTTETALRFGFVQKSVADGSAFDEALAIARRISSVAPLAVRSTIANARYALEAPMADAVRMISESMEVLRHTEDAEEGAKSFVERRPPVFKGK